MRFVIVFNKRTWWWWWAQNICVYKLRLVYSEHSIRYINRCLTLYLLATITTIILENVSASKIKIFDINSLYILTELAAGTREVEWTRIARKPTTKRTTLSAVHAWVTRTVVIIYIKILVSKILLRMIMSYKFTTVQYFRTRIHAGLMALFPSEPGLADSLDSPSSYILFNTTHHVLLSQKWWQWRMRSGGKVHSTREMNILNSKS